MSPQSQGSKSSPSSSQNTATENSPMGGKAAAGLFTIAVLVFGTLLVGATSQFASAHKNISPPPAPTSTRSGAVTLSTQVDRTSVFNDGDGVVRMELVLTGEDMPTLSQTVPTDLIVILDRSGSMSGEKMEQARTAVNRIIDQLNPNDRFALVSFSSHPLEEIPLSYATAKAKPHWHQVVSGIRDGGGTNMTQALGTAMGLVNSIREPGRATRAILLSDGHANNAATATQHFRELARNTASDTFILSTIGIGNGFDEELMNNLADMGTGNSYYLSELAQLDQILTDELLTARETVASALTVQLQTGAGVRVTDAAGYPLEETLDGVLFRPGALFAGQERRVWVTYQVPHAKAGKHDLGRVLVKFQHNGERHHVSSEPLPSIACVEKEEDFLASIDHDAWARSVVVDEFNQVQQDVAKYLHEGKKSKAKEVLDDFQVRNQRLNESVSSPVVAEALAKAEEQEADLDELEAGKDLGRLKALRYSASEARRVGAKRAPSSTSK